MRGTWFQWVVDLLKNRTFVLKLATFISWERGHRRCAPKFCLRFVPLRYWTCSLTNSSSKWFPDDVDCFGDPTTCDLLVDWIVDRFQTVNASKFAILHTHTQSHEAVHHLQCSNSCDQLPLQPNLKRGNLIRLIITKFDQLLHPICEHHSRSCGEDVCHYVVPPCNLVTIFLRRSSSFGRCSTTKVFHDLKQCT